MKNGVEKWGQINISVRDTEVERPNRNVDLTPFFPNRNVDLT
jgi:hypothetical protein